MPRASRLVLTGLGASVAGVGLALAAPSPARAAQEAAQTFNYTGDFQTYTVPQGVSSLQLTVTGPRAGPGTSRGELAAAAGPAPR